MLLNNQNQNDPIEVELQPKKHWWVAHHLLAELLGVLIIALIVGCVLWYQEIKKTEQYVNQATRSETTNEHPNDTNTGNDCTGKKICIISPKSGSEFAPGNEVLVITKASPGFNPKNVLIEFIPADLNIDTSNELQKILKVESDEYLGPKKIRALAANDSELAEDSVNILIEYPLGTIIDTLEADAFTSNYDFLYNRFIDPSQAYLSEKTNLYVRASNKGSWNYVTKSKYIKYFSSNPKVALVDSEGSIIYKGPGITTISASYMNKTTTMEFKVSILELKGDLSSDSDVDDEDMKIWTDSVKAIPYTGPGDPRDFDQDGRLDQKDFQKYNFDDLCSRPNCSEQ